MVPAASTPAANCVDFLRKFRRVAILPPPGIGRNLHEPGADYKLLLVRTQSDGMRLNLELPEEPQFGNGVLIRAHCTVRHPRSCPSADSGRAGKSQCEFTGGGKSRELQVRAESKQPAIAIFHYKFTHVPWHVGDCPGEFHASSGILSVKRVRIFDKHIRVEQFI